MPKRKTPQEYVTWYESLPEMAGDPEIQQDMANGTPSSKLARLQAENERLRAFVEGFIEEAPTARIDDYYWLNKWYDFADEAAALIASLQATAEDSE